MRPGATYRAAKKNSPKCPASKDILTKRKKDAARSALLFPRQRQARRPHPHVGPRRMSRPST